MIPAIVVQARRGIHLIIALVNYANGVCGRSRIHFTRGGGLFEITMSQVDLVFFRFGAV